MEHCTAGVGCSRKASEHEGHGRWPAAFLPRLQLLTSPQVPIRLLVAWRISIPPCCADHASLDKRVDADLKSCDLVHHLHQSTMSWDFDELDMLEVSRSSEDISGTRDWLSAVEDGGGRDELERSRRRIQAASLEGWQKVLDLHEADPTSVRKAYHNLARLHHPDKSRSHADAEVFKMVHKAYVDGLAAVAKEAYTDKVAVGTATTGTAGPHKKAWPLCTTASKDRGFRTM